jgi:helix-turn-helix protein
MGEKIKINGEVHIDTEEAAKRLEVTPKRILEFIRQKRLEALYLNGYYIPESELEKVKDRKPGRPAASRIKKTKKK